MQNYLQKRRRQTRARKLIVLFIPVAAILLPCLAAIFTRGFYTPQVAVRGEFSPSVYQASAKQYVASQTEVYTESVEMNNLQSDNAKSEILDVKNTKNRRKCDTVRVLFGDGTVRESPIEEYVKGCVMGEMPLSFEVQALMAQCVAVRTFTVRQALCGTSKHKNADVCTNPACCQSYAEISNLKSPQSIKKLEDAVNATRGIIMTYGGEPIEAVYHASSGTSTLNSEDVWGGRVEYLRSVKAPDGERAIAAGGMGHRVGLSQHGANILAKDGLSYTDILHYYYAGISFDFLL